MNRRALVIALAASFSLPLQARELGPFRWKKRPVVLFTDSKNNASFVRQKKLLTGYKRGMKNRDQVLIEVVAERVFVDGKQVRLSAQKLRKELGAKRTGFTFVLVGKDGGVKRKKSSVQSPSSFFCQIDRMPMRREEMVKRGQKSAC